MEVDVGGANLNVLHRYTNPLLNLTRDLELETARLGSPRLTVPWAGRSYSEVELVEPLLEASKVSYHCFVPTSHNFIF